MHPGPMNEGVEIAADVAAGAAIGHHRPGHQRGRGPDGAALPPGRHAPRPIPARRERFGPGSRDQPRLAGRSRRRDARARARSSSGTGSSRRSPGWPGRDADGIDADGVVVAPGFIDLHAHLREPGNEDAETIATGLAAAAHGGFTTVCAMPNTTPALDEPGVLAQVRAAAVASRLAGRAARLRRGDGRAGRGAARGARRARRRGRRRASRDDGSPVRSASILRAALAYAGALGLPIVDHPEEPTLTDGAEANDGFVATVLGLRGWPARGRGDGRRARPGGPRRRRSGTCRAPGCT